MTDITELAQLRGRTVDYPYYLVECDCGKIYPSSELSGGEPMGDSGDYSDCYCPHCGEGEEHFAECADPETAWKAQQDKIDALVEALENSESRLHEVAVACATAEQALEKAQQQTTESENRVRKQNRHICELFDDNTALRQRIAGLESRTVTVKLPDINEYLAEVHDKTLNRAFRLLAEGVRAGDVAAMRAAGIKVEAE
ncbi:hypothetical protein CUU02_25090 [Klebsiella pneumoniae]|uniref:hypothetical protein n=1 Tax=Klebsiella pneumoniae complex TaxID=3390273 RepID=UPI00067C6280|nr:hypothetical protein [Klebsiella pneumoniae]HDS4414597.1 hypothetical protein [Klebsiella pneumoniae subsp. pneumoniae]MBA0009433.1 hypothetical protein [Klebsiella pneumoniae]MBA0094602.1 hypothetical protein [Klebsiella pneumoniae]MBZ7783598.1 hypothetical protein [Klebsiella pneumoniae]MBZ7798586.1 hypothetical protein [Klebsiella pneumoniae]